MSLFFWDNLQSFGQNTALVLKGDVPVSYADLARLADEFAERLPPGRQLMVLQACNSLEAITAYLGCMRHRHPVILLGPEALKDKRIVNVFQPNFLYHHEHDGWHLEHLNPEPADCSQDLAVLLSTSGTTGDPKLVRLSQTNIDSNARSIATYLELDADERAITTLHFYYSYGMAVMNSHLSVGARIVLTDESIVSDGFWTLFQSCRATSLALVPYQFEYLDRIDFRNMDLPSLGYITQAGGRLSADKIETYGRLAQARRWRLFVMYGQTEASPRISYVPPEDLLDNLDAIGRPVPGGEIVLLDESGCEIAGSDKVGELVYRGPNVMLGYAETRGDLANPRLVTELRTGDLAERKANGYFKIVGRLKRFIKLYGLRINLDDVEVFLSAKGNRFYCSGTDELLVVFHVEAVDEARVVSALASKYNIRKFQIALRQLPEMPLMPSGKVDYAKLRKESESILAGKQVTASSVKAAFCEFLDEDDISDTDTFFSVGGDSLSYLNMSLFLEKTLGFLPKQWQHMTVAEIQALTPQNSKFMEVPVEMLLRVIAIILVVNSHIMVKHWFVFLGGSNVLMIMAGLSMAKYQGTRLKTASAARLAFSLLGRVLAVYYLVIIVYFIIFWIHSGIFFSRWLFLYSNFHPFSTHLYAYWFIAAYAHIVLGVILIWQIPIVRRYFDGREQRFGYILLAFGFLAAIVTKLEAATPGLFMCNTFSQIHLFALGWCVYYARALRSKLLILAFSVIAGFAFWNLVVEPNHARIYLFIGAVAALLWMENITLPRRLGFMIMWIASLSYYMYIVHILPGYLAHYTPSRHNLLVTVSVWLGVMLTSILMAFVVSKLIPVAECWVRTTTRAVFQRIRDSTRRRTV